MQIPSVVCRNRLALMSLVHFEFDQNLRDLLPSGHPSEAVPVEFTGPQSAKHLLEALGIPHTEIRTVVRGNQNLGLSYLPADGDVLEVAGINSQTMLDEPRFILDGHLGRLAAGLRMLGLDCAYENQAADANLARVACRENRVLLSRDRRLLMRKAVTQGYLVRSLEPDAQLTAVCLRFDLLRWFLPFRRCMRCNSLLQPAAKSSVVDRLLPLTRRYYDVFRVCRNCSNIYWAGSHMAAMHAKIDRLCEVLRGTVPQSNRLDDGRS